ncbi:MAG TPA: hypothetical protein VN715_05990 [Roseiarcus sp.]|nr:hypothetical protein [Roseiarcus sp.]
MRARPTSSEQSPLPFVLVTIERLSEAVERETHDLGGTGPVDYRAHSQRKSQGLLELSRLGASLSDMRGHPRLRSALGDLLAKLDANQRLLHAKLQAARTVAEIVARVISDGQSDGTYSDQIWRENRR